MNIYGALLGDEESPVHVPEEEPTWQWDDPNGEPLTAPLPEREKERAQ